MAFVKTNDINILKPGDHFMMSTKGMRGWFACEWWMNNEEPDLGTFHEPFQSDSLTYATEEEADERAEQLARQKEIPFII